MEQVQTVAEIVGRFKKAGENFERGSGQITKKISDAWVLMINLTDAIDSGDYLRAVAPHPVQTSGELLEYVIDTSDDSNVIYEGFVEGGTKYMEARHPAQKAVEREDFVSTILDLVEKPLS